MSIRIMKLVRQTDLPHFERYVLWTLADYANDDGGDIWPALTTIMADTGLSNGTLNRALAGLKRRGVLLDVRGGRGHRSRERRIDVGLLIQLGRPNCQQSPAGHNIKRQTGICQKLSRATSTPRMVDATPPVVENPSESTHESSSIQRAIDLVGRFIDVFEEAREEFFGERRAKVARSDRVTAEAWLRDGADVDIIIAASRKHFAWLAQQGGAEAPASLAALSGAVTRQLAKRAREDWAEGSAERERLQWVLRADHYMQNCYWSGFYGPRPGLPGCRLPKDLQAKVIQSGATSRDPDMVMERALAANDNDEAALVTRTRHDDDDGFSVVSGEQRLKI